MMHFPNDVMPNVWRLIKGMNDGEVKLVAQNDPIISQFAGKHLQKHTFQQKEYERAKIREVSRFLLQMRRMHGHMSLLDCLNPGQFQHDTEAVRKLAQFDEETSLCAKPSMAPKIGHTLKKCMRTAKTEAIISRDSAAEEDVDKFVILYEMGCHDEVSSHVLKTLTNRKRNKVNLQPISDDVVKLLNYLNGKIVESIQLLKSPESSADQQQLARRSLASVSLAQLVCFNRRRQREVSCMTVHDFENGTTADLSADSQHALGTMEKSLRRLLMRIEVRGKQCRTVPALVSPQLLEALETMNSYRRQCEIDDGSVYIFGYSHLENHLRGIDCLRDAAKKCGASYPERLRSTRLRKYVATIMLASQPEGK